jgi:hypothetical protein
MAKFAIVVTSAHGEANPEGQARLLHALHTAKRFRAAGGDVGVWFHGVGVGWLSAFDVRYDQFTRNYASLFDEIRPLIRGTCNFCTTRRFGAADAAASLGVPLAGADGDHHTVADLVLDDHAVFTF